MTDEEEGLRDDDDDEVVGEDPVVWQLGEASDDEDEPPTTAVSPRKGLVHTPKSAGAPVSEERAHMLAEEDEAEHDEEHRESTSSDATLARPDADEEFGDWNQSKTVGNAHS